MCPTQMVTMTMLLQNNQNSHDVSTVTGCRTLLVIYEQRPVTYHNFCVYINEHNVLEYVASALT